MQNKQLTISSSPHMFSNRTTKGIMLDVIIALMPAVIISGIIFGLKALILIAVTALACVIFEYLSQKVMKRKNSVGDLSAVLTGILLALNLPATLPLWMAIIGAFVAIVIVKQLFGGLGQNIVNPALCARIVLMISFPVKMTTWIVPLSGFTGDAITAPTPLVVLGKAFTQKSGALPFFSLKDMPSISDMLLGVRGGCLGETCVLALLAGGIYLIVRRVISPTIPVIFIGTVFLLTFFLGGSPVYQILSGGLILGAFFMATDYVTSPISNGAKIIFALGCGILTVVIRLYCSLPEGVSFAIILMNLLTPLIERGFKVKPFGKPKKA
jgi:Na+-translocating ferredoxin:NAD+ oxidoreductase subunit D